MDLGKQTPVDNVTPQSTPSRERSNSAFSTPEKKVIDLAGNADSKGVTPTTANMNADCKACPGSANSAITTIEEDHQLPPIDDSKGLKLVYDDIKTNFQMPNKESLMKMVKSPAVQFSTGTFIAKAVISPSLNVVKDRISDKNEEKQISEYYKESFNNSLYNLFKGVPFAIVNSFLTQSKYSVSEKYLVAKMITDVTFASAESVLSRISESLKKIVSIDYAKELAFFVGIGASTKTLSFLGLEEMVTNNPMVAGLVAGSSSDIIDLGIECGYQSASFIGDIFAPYVTTSSTNEF